MTNLGCMKKITTYGSSYSRTSGLNKDSHNCGKEIMGAGFCKSHYKLHIADIIKSSYNYLATARSKGWVDAVKSTTLKIKEFEAQYANLS